MMIMEQKTGSTRLEKLRKSINDENYVHAAVHRIAIVLSNGLMDMSHGGKHNERQRKRGRS